jgi:hypothetical protein
MTRRSWALIDADTHNDDSVEAVCTTHGPRAFTYWVVFILESKKVHSTKHDGWAGPFTLEQFAAMCYDEKAKRATIKRTIEAFQDAGMLEITGSLTGRWRARPKNFNERQRQGADAARKAASREAKNGASTTLGTGYVSPSTALAPSLTIASTPLAPSYGSDLQGKDANSHSLVTPTHARAENTNTNTDTDSSISIGSFTNPENGITLKAKKIEHPGGTHQQTATARTNLGSLAPLVDDLIANWEAKKETRLSNQRKLDWYYNEAIDLVNRFGRSNVDAALRRAASRSVYSLNWVRSMLEDSAQSANPVEDKQPLTQAEIDAQMAELMRGAPILEVVVDDE